MKTLKSILIAATLISASVVSTLSAQQAQPAQKHEFNVAIGDSVMIKRECVKYSTGEKPSVWVWDRVHTVRQLGTKRFPDGVLLMNIYSWICDTCLVEVNGHAREAAEEATAAQAAEKAAFEKAVKEGKDPHAAAQAVAEEKKAAEEAAAQEVAAEEAKPAAEEAAQVSEEATEQPVEEAVAEAQPAEQIAEPVEEQPAAKPAKGGYDRFTIGVRGGAASLLHKAENSKWGCGFDAILDLQYAHYWTKEGRPVDLGIIAGLGIGYSQSALDANVNSVQKDVKDEDGMLIDYSIQADQVKENDGQLQLEVPVMFSLIHEKGLFFNFGPKFMMPLYTPFKQTVSDNENTKISAYIQEVGVTVTNDEIMGQLAKEDYTQKGSDYNNNFTINVMLAAEIGYEWILKSGNSLGLGAYANYCVFNSFKNKTSNDALISVVTPPSGKDNAVIKVNPVTGTYASSLGFFDAGIKLAYHFNFPKKAKKAAAVEAELETKAEEAPEAEEAPKVEEAPKAEE